MVLKRVIKLWYFRLKYCFRNVTLRNGCNISIDSHFDGCNSLGRDTTFKGVLGYGSYIGDKANISAKIGKYCSIAGGVKVVTGTHPIVGYVSTSPVFYSLLKQSNITFVSSQNFEENLFSDKIAKLGVTIGNDVWIGIDTTIIGGVNIGDGAIVLANATVVKDVPPFAIVGGVPAKIIKMRFDDSTIRFLLEFKWWNKPPNWLQSNVLLFQNIEKFKNTFT